MQRAWPYKTSAIITNTNCCLPNTTKWIEREESQEGAFPTMECSGLFVFGQALAPVERELAVQQVQEDPPLCHHPHSNRRTGNTWCNVTTNPNRKIRRRALTCRFARVTSRRWSRRRWLATRRCKALAFSSRRISAKSIHWHRKRISANITQVSTAWGTKHLRRRQKAEPVYFLWHDTDTVNYMEGLEVQVAAAHAPHDVTPCINFYRMSCGFIVSSVAGLFYTLKTQCIEHSSNILFYLREITSPKYWIPTYTYRQVWT